ncbi:unnamed protein product [Amoebophrya sp. A25]|nr:unnamed protein product [Amoebophrya sp. A25]|eukprot:GSA25T00020633001.1
MMRDFFPDVHTSNSSDIQLGPGLSFWKKFQGEVEYDEVEVPDVVAQKAQGRVAQKGGAEDGSIGGGGATPVTEEDAEFDVLFTPSSTPPASAERKTGRKIKRKYEVHFVALDLRSFNDLCVTNPFFSWMYSTSNTWKPGPFVNALARTLQYYSRKLWIPVAALLGRTKSNHANINLVGTEQFGWFQNTVRQIFDDGKDLTKIIADATDESTTEGDDIPKLLVVGSSVQVLTKNPIFEGWHHNTRDLEHLFKILRPYKKRVLFLSGDVHFAEANTDDGYLEITSSGITHKPFKFDWATEAALWMFQTNRWKGPYVNHNFGRFRVDEGKLIERFKAENVERVLAERRKEAHEIEEEAVFVEAERDSPVEKGHSSATSSLDDLMLGEKLYEEMHAKRMAVPYAVDVFGLTQTRTSAEKESEGQHEQKWTATSVLTVTQEEFAHFESEERPKLAARARSMRASASYILFLVLILSCKLFFRYRNTWKAYWQMREITKAKEALAKKQRAVNNGSGYEHKKDDDHDENQDGDGHGGKDHGEAASSRSTTNTGKSTARNRTSNSNTNTSSTSTSTYAQTATLRAATEGDQHDQGRAGADILQRTASTGGGGENEQRAVLQPSNTELQPRRRVSSSWMKQDQSPSKRELQHVKDQEQGLQEVMNDEGTSSSSSSRPPKRDGASASTSTTDFLPTSTSSSSSSGQQLHSGGSISSSSFLIPEQVEVLEDPVFAFGTLGGQLDFPGAPPGLVSSGSPFTFAPSPSSSSCSSSTLLPSLASVLAGLQSSRPEGGAPSRAPNAIGVPTMSSASSSSTSLKLVANTAASSSTSSSEPPDGVVVQPSSAQQGTRGQRTRRVGDVNLNPHEQDNNHETAPRRPAPHRAGTDKTRSPGRRAHESSAQGGGYSPPSTLLQDVDPLEGAQGDHGEHVEERRGRMPWNHDGLSFVQQGGSPNNGGPEVGGNVLRSTTSRRTRNGQPDGQNNETILTQVEDQQEAQVEPASQHQFNLADLSPAMRHLVRPAEKGARWMHQGGAGGRNANQGGGQRKRGSRRDGSTGETGHNAAASRSSGSVGGGGAN